MEKKKVLTILGMMVVIIILGVAVVPKQQVAKAFSGWCPPVPVPTCGGPMMPPCSNNLCTITDTLHTAPFCVGGVCMYNTSSCCNGCNGACNGCAAPTCNNGNCCTLVDCPGGDSNCTCAALGGTNCGFAGACVGAILAHINSGAWTCCNGACAAAGPTCAAGDGCLAGCVPPDPDCAAGPTCAAGDGCLAGCVPPDPDCAAGPTCAAGDGCLAGCVPPDPDCAAGPTCAAGDGCLAGCVPADPDCAAIPPVPPAGLINIKNPITTSDFAKIVENTLLWLLSVAGVITIFMLVIGGIMYMTAGGDEQKVATAKKVVTWTIVGLGLILISYSIIAVLDQILVQ